MKGEIVSDKKLAFEGVKVLEWTNAATGTWSGRCFSDHGAEVIKVESSLAPDVIRVSLPYKDNIPGLDRAILFLMFNTGKKSITLDLKKPRGKELFLKLVGWSDIVLQSQRPGLMAKMGLGYNELKKIKNDIILLDISIMGQEGPLVGELGGWGTVSMAQSGQFYYYRFPDTDPVAPGFTATTDAIAPLYVAMVGIAALVHKRKTGQGQHIDMSQIEAIIPFVGPAILNYITNGKIQKPIGNRNQNAAPHNVFQCKGDDQWCTIAVTTNEEWLSFCNILKRQQWIESNKFATVQARKNNESELESLINEWTKQHSAKDVMMMMQEAGIPAGIVQNTEDIVALDPQVKARGLLPRQNHPVIGECFHTRWPFILSKTPAVIKTAPCLGEHSFDICNELLGISGDEFAELVNSEVII
jgi:benzylsuccinate CoA-transferase BbsF subunit